MGLFDRARGKAAKQPRVFLAYRRSDSSHVVGRMRDRLAAEFGDERVFYDFDSIAAGSDFRATIESALAACDLVIAIIGPTWLERINVGGDWIRFELAAALKLGKPVIPVLVGGSSMPTPKDLPPEIEQISYFNALALRADPDFHNDVSRLIAGIRGVLGSERPPAAAPSGSRHAAQEMPLREYVISRSSGMDDDWTRWLSWQLQKEGYDFYVDQQDVSSARPLRDQFRDWLSNSRRVLVVATQNYLAESSRSSEWAAVVESGALTRNGTCLVIAVDSSSDAEIRGALDLPHGVPIVSLHDLDEESARTALLAGLELVADPSDERTPLFPPDISTHGSRGESPYVFVSYSRNEKEYVDRLTTCLASRGVPTWVDHDIDYGDRWIRVIRDKIDSCAAFVVVMTPDGEESVWVEREIQRAQFKNKPILPILLDGVPFFLLAEMQHEDLRDRTLPTAGFSRKLRHILDSATA